MFTVYYQHPTQKNPCFSIYTTKKDFTQHFSVYEPLNQIAKRIKNNFDNNIQWENDNDQISHITNTLLLDNKYFSFFKFNIFKTFHTPISTEDLNTFLSEKKYTIKINENITAEFLTAYIDSIYVNGEKKTNLIGQKWEIFFKIYFIYIDDICLNTLKSSLPDILQTTSILPQSFYTMLFIRNNMQRNNFALLYITKDAVKVIHVQDWFYDGVYTINLGLNFLKKIYKDNDIIQYWNMSEEEIINNPIAIDLVIKSLDFYSEILCKWLREHNIFSTDIFLISSILKNGLFIDRFNTIYKKGSSTNYIIPFHHSSLLQKFGKKWNPWEMDVLVYFNRECFIKDKLLDLHISPSGFSDDSIAISKKWFTKKNLPRN